MLEQYRGFLFLMLAALTFFMYSTWQMEQQEKMAKERPSSETALPVTASETAEASSIPSVQLKSANADSAKQEVPASEAKPIGQNVTFTNDVLSVTVDAYGDIVETRLLNFKVDLKRQEKVRLLRNDHRVYVAQSGIYDPTQSGESYSALNVPDQERQRASWQLTTETLDLGQASSLSVPFQWRSRDGVLYTKTFTLEKGSYLIDVAYTVDNQTSKDLNNLALFTQIKRDRLEPENQTDLGFGISSYLGAAYATTEDQYEKYDFDDISEQNLMVETQGGWVAFLQHYFVSAWIPDQRSPAINIIFSEASNNRQVIVGMTSQPFTIAAGQSRSIESKFYAGPKDQDVLAGVADGLDRTIDYGMFFFLGQPLFHLLTFFHDGGFGIPGFGNWGLAIIFVTIFVKILLYPIFSSQYRSFARIKELHPKLMQIRERYSNDRQRQSQAMMELYKKEKVNPLGGCFQMLLTFPVFIALYWVLIESVEIRHAPFMLWIHDLSAKDPYFVLPVLMGASMFLMQKMQPVSPTQDPMQVKIMQMLPVFMTVLFLFFPAGLVLYWLINNLLSIGQQLVVTKKYEASKKTKKKNA